MRITALRFLLLMFLISAGPMRADLSIGRIYALTFPDVDGNNFSTTDGRITVIILSTEADLPKAQLLGDRLPDYCLGNSKYRMVTVVNLANHNRLMRAILVMRTRQRLDQEARRVQKRYTDRKVTKNPREEVFAVADFGGLIGSRLSNQPANFRVFIFAGNGELLRDWDRVPTTEEMDAVFKL